MTLDELQELYEAGKATIKAQRQMYMYMYRDAPAKRKAKVAEMTRLLQMWAAMKDVCKESIANQHEQPRLLDVPRKAEYP